MPHCQGVDMTWCDMLETVKEFVRMLIEEEYADKKNKNLIEVTTEYNDSVIYG